MFRDLVLTGSHSERMERSLIICLVLFAGTALGKKKCCDHVGCFTNDYPFNHFPLPQCGDVIQPSTRLYTRSNPKEGQVITSTTIPPAYMDGKPIVFVTHGYLNWIDMWWLEDYRDAFLAKFDYNVIIAGWARGAIKIDYRQAASNTRVAGATFGLVAKNLVERGGAKRSNLWCVGHSLGSHVCGHAGQTFKFGKVTGLDPAGPYFEDKDWSIGINPSVADFVDIWHTNGDTDLVIPFGTLKILGHVDFYPNGGGFQPGCIIDPYADKKQGLRQALEGTYIDPMPFCSHLRAIELYEEAISSDCHMYARQFCEDESNVPASCMNCPGDGICGSMGLDSHTYNSTGLLYVVTASGKPYCRE